MVDQGAEAARGRRGSRRRARPPRSGRAPPGARPGALPVMPGRITLAKHVPGPAPRPARRSGGAGRRRGCPREDGQHDREEAEQHAERDLRGGAEAEEEHQRRVPDDARNRVEGGEQGLVDLARRGGAARGGSRARGRGPTARSVGDEDLERRQPEVRAAARVASSRDAAGRARAGRATAARRGAGRRRAPTPPRPGAARPGRRAARGRRASRAAVQRAPRLVADRVPERVAEGGGRGPHPGRAGSAGRPRSSP